MPSGRSWRGWRTEWWIPAIYLVVSGAWIYGSDSLVAAVAGSVERSRVISTYKGLGFVVVTALLLNRGLRWALRRERAAARRLQESEALLRAITDAIPDPVFLKGRDGRWLFSNPATLQVIGKTMDQVIGKTDTEIYGDPEVGPALMETDRRIMAAGKVEVVEERILGPRGYRTFLSTKAPYHDAEGRLAGLIGNARDITDRKQAEQELLAAEERFQQAERLESVGRLAGGVAHDFNNLLTVILGASEVLEEDVRAGRAPATEDVAQIRAAGARAQELTGQLLAFARRQVTAPLPLDLNDAVRSSERLLRRLLGEEVQVSVDLEPGLWTVVCDPGQVQQVVLNLALNARDAMPRGGTLLLRTRNLAANDSAHRAGQTRSVDCVQLVVQDSGAGMSPEVMSHLFEPFFTTKARGRGTGLGLATVHGIVTQAGGWAEVRSAPDRGTTIEINLPRRHEAPVRPQPAKTEPSVGGSETVLVVEDDPAVREITARTLRTAGYRVLEAGDGARALELFSGLRETLQLLVTDVVMPGMDGKALADLLRRQSPALRVLFLSGYTHDIISHHSVLDPGVEFLPKPFTAGALLARVRSVLDAPET